MAAHDVESTFHHPSDEHKRVSFGGEKQIVYDDGIIDDCTLLSQHATKHNTNFTDAESHREDAPPSKVTVRSDNVEVPRPISPPAQLTAGAEAAPPQISLSPALPSFLKKMENESSENPFRPEESLYHEVDPIVEAYRQRPFPPSPTGSPVPPAADGSDSNQTTPARRTDRRPEIDEMPSSNHHNSYYKRSTTITTTVTDGGEDGASPNTSTTTTTTMARSSKQNGSSSGGVARTASLAEGRTSKFDTDAVDASKQPLIVDGDGVLLPPHKAELVHIEKKRKCCICCCLQ